MPDHEYHPRDLATALERCCVNKIKSFLVCGQVRAYESLAYSYGSL